MKTAYGSITGRLMRSDAFPYVLCIYNPNQGFFVTCEIKDALLDKANDALGKRVSIYGKITYNKDNVPIKISVQKIRQHLDDLPTPQDVLGILGSSDKSKETE